MLAQQPIRMGISDMGFLDGRVISIAGATVVTRTLLTGGNNPVDGGLPAAQLLLA